MEALCTKTARHLPRVRSSSFSWPITTSQGDDGARFLPRWLPLSPSSFSSSSPSSPGFSGHAFPRPPPRTPARISVPGRSASPSPGARSSPPSAGIYASARTGSALPVSSATGSAFPPPSSRPVPPGTCFCASSPPHVLARAHSQSWCQSRACPPCGRAPLPPFRGPETSGPPSRTFPGCARRLLSAARRGIKAACIPAPS